jgi:hypothetical protein
VRQNRSSLAHPSLHNCSLRPYRSIATPNVWIPTTKSMKRNTGKESPTAANDCCEGATDGAGDHAQARGPIRRTLFVERIATEKMPQAMAEGIGR